MLNHAPIMFCDQLVEAIIAGRKWVTRRVCPIQPKRIPGTYEFEYTKRGKNVEPIVRSLEQVKALLQEASRLRAVNVLWVRESVYCVRGLHRLPRSIKGAAKWPAMPFKSGQDWFHSNCEYASNRKLSEWERLVEAKEAVRLNKQFMPRWASNVELEGLTTRIEQLHEITEAEAALEGLNANCPIGNIRAYQESPFVYHFAQLWEQLNGAESWNVNPFVSRIGWDKIRVLNPFKEFEIGNATATESETAKLLGRPKLI